MKVYPTSLTELYIEWSLQGEGFQLSRSTSPDSDFDLVAINLTQPFYTDYDVNLYDENVRYYYKVEGFVNGNKVSEDGPGTLEYNSPDGVANKVIQESETVLRMMNNPPVYFLLKRRAGYPCPECWNPITKRCMYANCPTCNGTGVMDGYHDPIPSRVSQDVSQLLFASGELDSDKVRLSPIRAWTTNVPLLYPEDVMCDVLNQRYKIVNVARRTRSQFVIRQILDLVPLEKGHPSYQVDVDRTVQPI
jgi:hypothetical protein